MARTLATFFGVGGAAGLLVTLDVEPGTARQALVVLSCLAGVAGAVVGRWGARWPRPLLHATVGAATPMIVTAVLIAPDPVSALAAATLIAFVVIDAHFFFSGRAAFCHLAVAVVGVTAGLLASDVGLGTTLGFDLVLASIGVVIRQLVSLASDASRDPLTRLRNRRGFDNALAECMAEADRTGEPLAAALLDLDHFKAINDTAGHEAGDRMLCRVADAWTAALPHHAELARHGGDEFSLVLPRMTGDEALALVRRVCAMNPDIRLSCGVAEHHPGETASQLMRRADRALYEAKAAGRGRAELDGAGLAAPLVDGGQRDAAAHGG